MVGDTAARRPMSGPPPRQAWR